MELEKSEGAGDLSGEVQQLMAAARERESPELERRLVGLRRDAFARIARGGSVPRRGDPAGAAPIDPSFGLPRVMPEQLDARILGDTIAAHGVLVCPGLVPPRHVEALRDTIDRAFEARRALEARSAEPSSWYEPIPEINPFGREFNGPDGMYICDSPRSLFRLLEAFDEIGVLNILRERLGGAVGLMPDKCMLRRVRPQTDAEWADVAEYIGDEDRSVSFHQDAGIIDTIDAGASVIDVWTSLSHCGRDAPGLELVPVGLQHLVTTMWPGQANAPIHPATADAEAERAGVRAVLPELAPGDVVFIDQFTVHGTSFRRRMREVRYSVEGWFISASAYPDHRPGLLV